MWKRVIAVLTLLVVIHEGEVRPPNQQTTMELVGCPSMNGNTEWKQLVRFWLVFMKIDQISEHLTDMAITELVATKYLYNLSCCY